MADDDPKFDASIIGRDADAARETDPRDADPLDQLSQTTSESAGGNVDGTAEADDFEGFDIVFEREDLENTRH